MVNYNNIFLQKTGQFESSSPWDDTKIIGFLDNSACLASRTYSTPWADFTTVPAVYQYAITIFAAIEFWWMKAGEYASKFDMQVGGTTGQKSSQLFDRALQMIAQLQGELTELDMLSEGSGDIIVGDLVRRSKFSGFLVPRVENPLVNWLS